MKNHTPKISVIVPVYNVEKYLSRCIDSILAQTFTDFELLLIDDGSTDNSGRICDGYAGKDNRIRVFHKENGGVSSARNLGLDNAKGEYIAFIDADDWIEIEYLNLLYSTLREQNADIVACDYIIERKHSSLYINQDYRCDIVCIIKKLLNNDLKGYLWNRLFTKKLFINNNIHFPEGIGMWEDLLIIVDLYIKAKHICYLPNALYHYWLSNPLSATYSFNEEKMRQKIYVSKLLEECLEKSNLKKVCLKELYIRQLIAKMEYATDYKLCDFKEWNAIFPDAFQENCNLKYPLWIKIQQWFIYNKLYLLAHAVLYVKKLLKK